MMRALVLVIVVGCGRIGFDPIGGAGDAKRDAPVNDAKADAATACGLALDVQLNVRKATSTCVGGDLLDSCGPAGTQEVVFAFTPSVTNGYTFRAFDPGTNNVSNSTQQLGTDGCMVNGGCSGILGVTVNAGTTAYFVVEAAAGGCTNIEFEVQ